MTVRPLLEIVYLQLNGQYCKIIGDYANSRFHFRVASFRFFRQKIPTSEQIFDVGASFSSFCFEVNFLKDCLKHDFVIRLESRQPQRSGVSKIKLVTVVEGDPKASFSIATTPRCRGERYSFLWIATLYFDPYLIMLSVKQGSTKYHFYGNINCWYDSTLEWTLVSRAISEHWGKYG